MRSAGNFSPEWGYLAPTPSLARTARVVLVATAIGATAGAGVVLSLVERPAEAQKMPIATRAIVTSVRETAVPSVAPAVGTAAVTSATTGVSTAPTPAPTPVAASASPPALKLGASARTSARTLPQMQPQTVNPPLAVPALVPAASATSAPSASTTPLSATNSAPALATAATTANASATTAVGSSGAPQAADVAPAEVPESLSIIPPETLPPKKAKRHASGGQGSILRRPLRSVRPNVQLF